MNGKTTVTLRNELRLSRRPRFPFRKADIDRAGKLPPRAKGKRA